MCQQFITWETGWNIHHVVERHKGGGDELDNLVLLHPNCHRQLHAASTILAPQGIGLITVELRNSR